jgi:hypothetical protein
LPFPELRALGDIRPIAFEREDQRAHSAFRPEPQVHAERVALLGHGLERRHDVAHGLREVFAVGNPSGVAARRLTVLAVYEDQVDVRGVVELVPAQLAHRDDGQAGGRSIRVDGRSVAA